MLNHSQFSSNHIQNIVSMSNDARTMNMNGKKRKRRGKFRPGSNSNDGNMIINTNLPIPPRRLRSFKNNQQKQFCSITGDENEDPNRQSQSEHATHAQKKDQRFLLYKTELCREWMASGWCYYDSRCSFAHSMEELRPVQRPDKWRTQRCRNWHTTGYCPYEHRCQFLHDHSPPKHGEAQSINSMCPTVPMQKMINREVPAIPLKQNYNQSNIQRRNQNPVRGHRNRNARGHHNATFEAKKIVSRRPDPPAQMQSSHNSNAHALCEAQQRIPPLYFHYNVESKAERDGNKQEVQVTPYTVDQTATTPTIPLTTAGFKDAAQYLPVQPPQRIDRDGPTERVGDVQLKRNLQTLSLSQTEQRGLTVELPPSLTPSTASDCEDEDDAKNCHDGMGAAQGTTEVDAMDRKLHLKLTEQRQKLKAMQHRVETMKRAQSLTKRRDDDDDRKENGVVHGSAVPFADMLQYMLPTPTAASTAAPIVNANAPIPAPLLHAQSFSSLGTLSSTPRGRVNMLSPRPATMVNAQLSAQKATPRGAMSEFTPRMSLPFNFSCSPSPMMPPMNLPQNILTPRTPMTPLPPAAMLPSNGHRAQVMAAQSQFPGQFMASLNPQAISNMSNMSMPSLNAFDIFGGSFSMSPDLPPIPDPSQYLSNLSSIRNSNM